LWWRAVCGPDHVEVWVTQSGAGASCHIEKRETRRGMKTLAEACKPRDTIFDSTRRDTVLDLTDLVEDRIDVREFFAENHITEGMRILLTNGFRRQNDLRVELRRADVEQ